MKHLFRTIAGISTALMLAVPAAAEYPDQPIKVMVPYGAGGSTDTSGRIFIEAMKKALGAELFAVNVTGAGGTVGAAQAASENADGYSIFYTPIAPVTVQPHLRNLSYGEEDFTPICGLIQNPLAVMVAPDSPYQTVQDLVDAARAGEEIVAVGTAPGSIPHITQAALANAYDITFKYVPVGGGPKQAAEILSGRATISTDILPTATLFGLRALAVISDERVDGFDVPTMAELGVDVPTKHWFGVFAPAGTPEDAVAKLADACEVAAADPELVEKLGGMNFAVRFRDRAEFTEFYASEFQGNRDLLKLIGIELE